MLKRIGDAFFRCLDYVLAFLLGSMAIMVFVNVVLRYTANSGIPISEELSRFAFVWLTFIGAVVAHNHHLHMGMETLVAQLGRRGRLIMMGASNLLIIYVSAVLLVGAWKQVPINAAMKAPVSGVSMAWVYGVGVFAAAGIILVTTERLFRLLTGRITEHEINEFAGEKLTPEELAERAT
ncbi:MAG: TRAP transporter small permease [Paracoccus sp. (in: a-proteobacteria)]|nr:TRAP transporter small permease [Paracoccus sp. (in: a-proteobacteria)]